MSMDYLPLFLAVKGQPCTLVGGGEVAARKAALLHRCGASIRLVAPEILPDLRQMLEQGGHQIRLDHFQDTDIKGSVLVIAATDDRELNSRISVLARESGVPVNVVDEPSLCSVIFPAVVDRNPVLVAISSSGTSPVLARTIKEQIEVMLPQRTGDLARQLGSLRSRIKQRIPNFSQRLRFWESVMESPVPELVYAGKLDEAQVVIESLVAATESQVRQGEVYLVGAGPGDPDLLTLRALRLMQRADVVLYDRLVSPEIMARIRPDAEKIHVGKERSRHPVPQEQINSMLVRLAREGKRVLRLKGGDPFIFGRGGEEIEQLMENRVPFQVVPGITAASGCASYAGIPLTHRELSQSVIFLTGHDVDGIHPPNWQLLARENQTLVFYMSLLTLELVCQRLVQNGLDSETPAALVQQGTTVRQKVVAGTVQSLASLVAAEELIAPTLLIIGKVVALRDRLAWFSPNS